MHSTYEVYLLIMRGLCLFLLTIFTLSCSLIKGDSPGNQILFDISGTPVSSDEFIYNLRKNSSNNEVPLSKDDIEEYLELYINFKLKVREAVNQGLDTTESFNKEFSKYRNQLTESYLKDDSIIMHLVQEAYERMQVEVNASHIIIRIQNPNNPIDTLQAFNRISNLHSQLDQGADFQELAMTFSEDPSVRINRGNLGYFTVLQMVYPFETMAYTTTEGSYSDPFKTKFGYHILKVNDKRPARGKVEVAHIMLRMPNNATREDSAALSGKINMIYDSLNRGGNWDALCGRFSEDANTRNQGGMLQPFETGRVIPAFSEAAFNLTNPGDISRPVFTPYGWHILKLIRKHPLKPYPEIKDELTERVKRDARSELTQTYLIRKLKQENDYVLYQDVYSTCLDQTDSSLIAGTWAYSGPDSLLNKIVFTIRDNPYYAKDLFEYIHSQQSRMTNTDPGVYMKTLIDQYVDEMLVEFEKENLEDKYFDYKMLVREYREGILLFDLMDKEVWNKAIVDTTGLVIFFNENRDRYRWSDRMQAMIFSASDPGEIDKVRDLLSQTWYTIPDTRMTFQISESLKILEKDYGIIDSLYQVVSRDTTKFLEVTTIPSVSGDLIMLAKKRGWSLDEIMIEPTDQEVFTIKIVSNSKKWVEKEINENSALTLQIESGVYEKGEHGIIDRIDFEPGYHDLSIEELEYLVFIENVIPAQPKELDEVRGQVISDYQNYLEEEWIKQLRNKYSIHIDSKILSRVYEQFKVN